MIRFNLSPRLLPSFGLLFSIILYTVLCLLAAYSVDGNVVGITSDFDFYNNAIVRGLNGHVSELSRQLFQQSPYIDPSYRAGWVATPFYSYLFLSPIWLFGSQALFGLLGWLVGSLTIFSFYRIIRFRLSPLPRGIEFMLLLVLPLNFNFIVDSLAVSTMSVAAMFIVSAFATASPVLRAFLLVCAAMTRSNYLIAAFCFLVVLAVFKPSGARQFFLVLLPSLAITATFYLLFYSSYPGSGLNYLFSTVYQGLDYAQPQGVEIARSTLGIDSEDSLFRAEIGFPELIRLFSTPKAWAYVLNVWALKVSVALGFVHEKLFQSDHGIWLAKAWRTLFFVSVSLPGVYLSLIVSLFCKIPMTERAMYAWAFLYLAFNSLLIGDPRYLMGVYMIFVFGMARLIAVVRHLTSSA